jgi:acetyl-CoA C-acetyltransferase
LSARGKWLDGIAAGVFGRDGRLPVNPSGGVRAINPVFCTGLIRIAEAANQVRGVAGAHQIQGAKTALSHAASGFAMQYQTVAVLGQER